MKTRILVIALVLIASVAAAAQKFTYIQTNFTSGELSEKMGGRVDFAKYFNGVQNLDNFIIYPQGGVVRRSGFEYINSAKTSNESVRLIPFEFSTEQAYVLEFGDEYMRVYKDGGRVVSVDSYTKLLLHGDGNDASVTVTDSGATTHTVTVAGDAQIDEGQYKFGGSSLLFDGLGDYVYAADHADWYMGTDPVTIDFWVRFDSLSSDQGFFQNYQDASSHVQFYLDQASSVLRFWVIDGLVTDPSLSCAWTPVVNTWYHLAVIRGWGSGANTWALCINGVAVTTVNDTDGRDWPNFVGAFEIGRVGTVSQNLDGWIEEFRVSKGIARWTANFTPPTIEYPQASGGSAYELATPWLTEDLRDLKYVQSADTMWIVHEDYEPRKLTRTGHAAWSLEVYSPTADPFNSATMYPASVAFFEERLCFGGTYASPQNLWLSVSGDFNDMTTGTNADDAISIAIASDDVNSIKWLEPGKILVVGTVGGEWKLGASTLGDPITPTDLVASRESTYGSEGVQAETIGRNVLFVQRGGKKIREFGYNFDVDGYVSHDLNILADTILGSPIVEMAYQQEPYSIVWFVTQAGKLCSMTYHKDHEIIAWAEHPVGGTGVEVKSVCVIPGEEEDEVWISVERDLPAVSGGTRINYIERMRPLFTGTDVADGFFADSGLAYEGGGTTSVSGLDHLEGETVCILCDGEVLANQTIADGGTVALGQTCTKVVIGLPYNSNIETLRLAVPQDQVGTVQGKLKSVDHVTLRLLESLECKIGQGTGYLEEVEFDDGTTAFSGDKRWPFDMGFDSDAHIYIRQDKPLPLTVLAIIPEVSVGD